MTPDDTAQAQSSPPPRMRAAVRRRYGGPEVLAVEDVPTPSPGRGEVLVRVVAASVNAGDRHLMRGTPWPIRFMFGGLLRPRITTLGSDVAGTVIAVGSEVDAFAPGDEVVGELSEEGFGAFAEYVAAPQRAFARRPDRLSWDEAAGLPAAGRAALQALRDVARVERGERVLVHGATGGVGSLAAQIARARGAHVTAVGGAGVAAMLGPLGFDDVVDRTRADVFASGRRFDVVIDTALHRSIRQAVTLLAPGGRYVVVGGAPRRFFEALARKRFLSRGDRTVETLELSWRDGDLAELVELAERGDVTPTVDTVYPLARIADALRHVETGHPRGKLVVTM